MKSWFTRSGYKIIQLLSGRSNVFLLTDSLTNILIDTGPRFMWKTLEKRLERMEIEQISLLILTHSHFDHTANAARIKKIYKAMVIIHRLEALYLSTGDNILPVGTNKFSKFLVKAFSKQFNSFAKYQPCSFDYAVDDEFSLSEWGFNAYLMYTPGHTPGSMSLIIDNEIALVGDTMFGIFPGRVFPPFASDQAQMLLSWEKLLKTGCREFIPSHGSANDRAIVENDLKRRTYSTRNRN